MSTTNPIAKKPAFNFSKAKHRPTAEAANFETKDSLICPLCKQSWSESQYIEHLAFHRRKPKGMITDVETVLKMAEQKKSLQRNDSDAGSWFIRSQKLEKKSSSGQSQMKRISEQLQMRSKRNSDLSFVEIVQTEQSMIEKSQVDVKHRRRFSQTGKQAIDSFENPEKQSKKQSSSLINELKESYMSHKPEETFNSPKPNRHSLQNSYCSNKSQPSQSERPIKHQRAKNPLIHFDT